ncbi:MAG: ABC transporter permease [Acidimicrobiia bacterium]
MSPLRQIYEVARRDFVQRARSKAFLITTLLTVAAIFGLVPLLASEIRDPAPPVVGLVGESEGLGEQIAVFSSAFGVPAETRAMTGREAAEDALMAGELDALVVDGMAIEFAERVDDRLVAVVDTAVRQLARDRAIERIGISPEEAESIVAPRGVETVVLSPPDEDALARSIGAQFGAILMYMAILIFGQFILMGVMEEKQSRVVEVVLSRMRAERLLTGKIIGIGLLGLVQLILIGGALVGAVVMLDVPGLDLPRLGAGILVRTVLWFLLGFGLYAVLYGALGATVTRQEDSQGAAMLPAMLLLPGYFVSFTAIENPDGVAAVIGSLFPFTAPVVMPVRAATGTVPGWQVLVAVALVILTTMIAIRLGARVYRGAVLSIGAKVRIRDALRASGR